MLNFKFAFGQRNYSSLMLKHGDEISFRHVHSISDVEENSEFLLKGRGFGINLKLILYHLRLTKIIYIK